MKNGGIPHFMVYITNRLAVCLEKFIKNLKVISKWPINGFHRSL
jgi:hypothetical protein